MWLRLSIVFVLFLLAGCATSDSAAKANMETKVRQAVVQKVEQSKHKNMKLKTPDTGDIESICCWDGCKPKTERPTLDDCPPAPPFPPK